MARHPEGNKLTAQERRAFDEIVRYLELEDTPPTPPARDRRSPWRRRRRGQQPGPEPGPGAGNQ